MAKAILRHDPSLTPEQLFDLLKKHYGPMGYEVGESALIGAQYYIRKSAFLGATVKLRQRDDSTTVMVNGYAPSPAVRILLSGLLLIIIMMPKWLRFAKEVKEYLEASPLGNGRLSSAT